MISIAFAGRLRQGRFLRPPAIADIKGAKDFKKLIKGPLIKSSFKEISLGDYPGHQYQIGGFALDGMRFAFPDMDQRVPSLSTTISATGSLEKFRERNSMPC